MSSVAPSIDAVSSWPASDDLALKLAIESGIAMRSIGGANSVVTFSLPRDRDDVVSRWRAMLYDRDFSRACVERMERIDRNERNAIVARASAEFAKRGVSLATALEREFGRGRRPSASDLDGVKDDLPRFHDVEQAILTHCTSANGGGTAGVDRKVRARERERALKRIEALERSAQAASARLATAKGALAELVGLNATFTIDKRECVIGRSTDGQKVDVDLCSEGNASKISRQQAFLKLRWNGEFALRNVGRRPIWVSNQPLTTGQRCVLAPHTLIEVGGMRLLFVPNAKLVRSSPPEGAA